MRKVILGSCVLVIALAFAFTANAGKTKVTTKTQEEKEVTDVTTTPEALNVVDVTKFKQGSLWKDEVTFKEYKKGDDFVYFVKEDKTYRVKLRDKAKENLMKLKKGTPVTVYSTYPLAGPELEQYIEVDNVEKVQ